MNFHKILSKAKEKALYYLDTKIIMKYRTILSNENISPSEKQEFEILQELRKDISSLDVWPVNITVFYNLVAGIILPIISNVTEIVSFLNI